MLATFAHRVSQMLHDEHCATIALMERLEQVVARHRRGPPDVKDPALAQLLGDLSTGFEPEVERHFAFEEAKLFTRLAEVGDTEIAAHLTDEHNAMRPLGRRLTALAREGLAQGFDQVQWNAFCSLGQELSERMLAHVQKEEMALVPMLDDLLDADTDAQLYQEYSDNA